MDRNRGCPPGIVRSEPLRPPLPPGFYDGPPHAPHHHHYLREVEDCSCTSASEDEEGRIHDERPRNSSQHPKKKCQLIR
ncbi:Hypothetical protein FKW44_015943 [Caligus rogercresseyi]|uniref:Uncharacterized protein n=1 Tax=Caligus rogercresseyi TaxID=217165 RepID=A0A7T8H114_CALRO|nr:Hypothetical protein FKW44_015943 [Caligus rogercresseyi]